jgi:hypothetical protein
MAMTRPPVRRSPKSAEQPKPPDELTLAWFKDFAEAQKQLNAPAKLMARLDRLLAEAERPK